MKNLPSLTCKVGFVNRTCVKCMNFDMGLGTTAVAPQHSQRKPENEGIASDKHPDCWVTKRRLHLPAMLTIRPFNYSDEDYELNLKLGFAPMSLLCGWRKNYCNLFNLPTAVDLLYTLCL